MHSNLTDSAIKYPFSRRTVTVDMPPKDATKRMSGLVNTDDLPDMPLRKSLLQEHIDALGLPSTKVNKSASNLSINDMLTVGWTQTTDTSQSVFLQDNHGFREKMVRSSPMATSYIKHFEELRDKWIGLWGPSIKVSRDAILEDQIDIDQIYKESNGADLQDLSFKIALSYVSKAHKELKDIALYKHLPFTAQFKYLRNRKYAYPEPHLILPRVGPDIPKESQYSKQGAVHNLLTISKAPATSELAVERTIGSAITGMLCPQDETMKMEFRSNQKADFLPFLKFGPSEPFPDFFCRMLGELQHKYKFHPLLLVGESKLHLRGSGSPTDSSQTKPNYRAQLAAAAHPTLLLMILQHLLLNDLPHGVATAKTRTGKFVEVPDLPDYCFLYGIYYDEDSVDIFVHFPALFTADDGERSWKLVQLPLQEFILPNKSDEMTESHILTRWRLAVALATIERQMEELHNWFTLQPSDPKPPKSSVQVLPAASADRPMTLIDIYFDSDGILKLGKQSSAKPASGRQSKSTKG